MKQHSKIVTLGWVLCLAACGGGEAVTSTSQPTIVETFEVTRQARLNRAHRYSGRVRNGQLSVLSFELGGQVEKILVEEGDFVQRGAPLARLDRARLRAAVQRSKAGLARAKAQFELSARTDRRVRDLAKQDFASAQRADEVRFGAEVAEQSVEELEAALSSLRIDLDKSVLKAPFSGRINRRFVDDGTVVGAGSAVLQLMSQKGKEVFVGIGVETFKALKLGQAIDVEVSGRKTKGTVSGLIDEIDMRTRTVGLVVTLPPDFEAYEGELADVAFELMVSQSGFWAPTTALRPGPEGQWTVLSVEDDKVRPSPVSVLHTKGEQAYLDGQLASGDRVVRAGLHRLVPGQKVQMVGGAN